MSKPQELVVFDTEFTAWPGSAERQWSGDNEHREIIQIAAVYLRRQGNGLEVVASFNELVKPQVNPVLSPYIIELTGIQQQTLEDMAVDYESALHSFYQFCDCGGVPCFSWGDDASVLRENCHLHQVVMPVFSHGICDLKQRLPSAGLEVQHLCSGELAQAHGIEMKGHLHNALHDVRSIVASLNQWLQQEKLEWSSLR